ncbi:hypothetical protein D3C87_914820 [compost metagenome]
MNTQYEIVHIKSNKEPVVIATVYDEDEVRKITESARFAGTWISDIKKVLRYGRGELRVHVRCLAPKITGHKTIIFQKFRAYDLEVINHATITCIRINAHFITGYDINEKQLWETQSFKTLSDIVGKELAYVCSRYYDQFIEEFKLASAI